MSDPTGGETPTGHAPGLAHQATGHTLGAETIRGATLGVVPPAPEMPHSGEQCSPEERREAWLKLVATLEQHCLAVEQRELSAAQLLRVLYRDIPGYIPRGRDLDGRAVERALARAWAARKLLDGLGGLQAPEVPRDDVTGQASILDLVAVQDGINRTLLAVEPDADDLATNRVRFRLAGGETVDGDQTLMRESTGVDNPGEDEHRPECNCSQRWDAPKGGDGDPRHCPVHGGA